VQILNASTASPLSWRNHHHADNCDRQRETGVPVYFCDPRSPWQRGSNENTNGLLRQYFPKRTEISHYTQAELDDVAAELNGRARQTLGFKTPSQALDEALR
jgi:IS30 family transposase